MEYPIIDTITNAYIRNGWTGLNVETGKNLFDPDTAKLGFYIDDSNGEFVQAQAYVASDYIQIKPNTNYVIQPIKVSGNWGAFYDVNKNFISGFTTYNNVVTPANAHYIAFTVGTSSYTQWRDTTQLEEGTIATPYEPYHATTDIKNRLKLPMIHYFPHPVIDALQRAAAGTQTADDTEILRHYLTPLGIGGI